MTPTLFLDIDGVLNCHDANRFGICQIDSAMIERLNRLIELTSAEVVVSSAWRYMILGGAMTVDGFRYMLTTHGLGSHVKIVGHTKSDEEIAERGDQISEYLERNWIASPYIVLDDGSELPQGSAASMSASLRARHGERWILIDGKVGLTDDDVARAVAVLDAQSGTSRPSEPEYPVGVRWNEERGHPEEEVCLGCNKPTRLRDCGCPCGTGWRRWRPEAVKAALA